MARASFEDFEKAELLLVVEELQRKLTRKKDALKKTKAKLVTTRHRLKKMEDTVAYQRRRILELYRGTEEDTTPLNS